MSFDCDDSVLRWLRRSASLGDMPALDPRRLRLVAPPRSAHPATPRVRPHSPFVADALARARRELIAAVAPPACLACGDALASADAELCERCRRALPWLSGPCCPRCALPLPCGDPCPAEGASFTRAWAPLAYDGVARALVGALKFRGSLPVAELMAAQLAAGIPRELVGGDGVALVPVPLPPARQRTRGFDQARRIATALAARTGLPLEPCLRRAGPATRQLGASAAALREAGSDEVVAIAYARALRR